MRIRFVVGTLTTFMAVAPSQGETPLGTAFTYQGQLKEGGVPFDGTADFQFTLWDAPGSGNPPVGGTQIGGLQAINAQSVSAGLFNVSLNANGAFGANAFNGNVRWLQVAVRSPAGGGAFTTLVPRQSLTPTPQALVALSVPGLDTTAAGVEVSGDVHALGQIAASAYTSNSPFIIKVNPLDMECARFEDEHCYLGLGTTDPQARLHVGGIPGVDGIMFPDGSMQTTAAGLGGGDGFWSLSAANIYNNNGGNVGIGTTTPHHRLRIGGGPSWTSSGWIGSLEFDYGSALGWHAADPFSFGFGIGQSQGGLYFFRTASGPGTTIGPATYDMVINDFGNIGIGTTAPQSKVEIALTGDGAELLRFSTERPWVFRQIRTGPSTGLQLLSTIGQKKFEITSVEGYNVATFFADGANSRVGIGTADPSTEAKLHLVVAPRNSKTYGVYSENNSSFQESAGVFGSATASNGFFTYGGRFECASTLGTGVYGHATATSGTTYGVLGRSDNSTGFDVYAGGVGIDYGSSSSIRWKSNVRNIDQPREKLARLRGVYFDWDTAHGGHHDLGMIAEEVGAVLPEIVGYEENGIDAAGMDYSKLTPLLVEAAKDQQQQIDALRQMNAELLKRLEALEARRR